uniref:RNA helicase n=1 Tax=Ditylenchus dipsaci TaxID=166011 RepID=A0A915EMQ3_9BILA
MLTSAFPKLWLRAVRCTKVFVLPKSSFGLRVRCLSGFSGQVGVEAKSNLPLTVQQAGYNRFADSHLKSNYQGGQGSYGNQVAGSRGGTRRQDFGGKDLPPIKYDNLEPINKELYQEHPSVTNRSQLEIDHFLAENQVSLHGQGDTQRPIFNFEEASFPEPILRLLQEFSKPSVIQSVSWPLALSGKDIISVAKTGSGKTLAFVLPSIMHILRQPARSPGDGPTVLVILPTRELAQQVGQVAQQFCGLMGLKVSLCYGGAPSRGQAEPIRAGVDMLVGTPGRLMDFMQQGVLKMRRCSFLVLDEADRMLDMGFEPQIRKIVGQVRPDRQTLMYSATWPKEIRKLAAEFQSNQVLLTVGSTELAASHNITQHVEVMGSRDKQDRLFKLLHEIITQPDNKTIVFVNLKREIENLTKALRTTGYPALAIHGGKEQVERDFVLNEFRSGKQIKILVATDVAGRGLDVNDVKFVINYDFPKNSEDYVHRIGRTGRGDKLGTSYTFFTNEDAVVQPI